MKQVGKVALVTLGFGVLIAVLGFTTNAPVGAQGPPGGLDVTVVNTPLPVTGSLSISGTPTVNAQQSGTWNVGINGTPTVAMPTHLGAQPSDLVTLECVGGAGGDQCAEIRRIFPDGTEGVSAFTIPNGKSLIITDIQWCSVLTSGVATGTQVAMSLTRTSARRAELYASSAIVAHDIAGESFACANEHLTAGLRMSVVPGATPPCTGCGLTVTLLGYLATQ